MYSTVSTFTYKRKIDEHVITCYYSPMAKLMLIRDDDDYRAMIVFKGLLLMGIEYIPLPAPKNSPIEKAPNEQPQCH